MAPAATDEVTEAAPTTFPVHGKPTKSTISASVLHGPRDLRVVSTSLSFSLHVLSPPLFPRLATRVDLAVVSPYGGQAYPLAPSLFLSARAERSGCRKAAHHAPNDYGAGWAWRLHKDPLSPSLDTTLSCEMTNGGQTMEDLCCRLVRMGRSCGRRDW